MEKSQTTDLSNKENIINSTNKRLNLQNITTSQKVIIGLLIVTILCLISIIFFFLLKNIIRRFRPFVSSPLSYISSSQTLNPKPPDIILKAITATSVDPLTGDAVSPSNVFNSTDKTLFIVLQLNNAKYGTKISYTRYLNNKFLDNKTFTLKKNSSTLFNFDWSIKNGTSRPKGKYKVRLYSNGIYERTVSFTIE